MLTESTLTYSISQIRLRSLPSESAISNETDGAITERMETAQTREIVVAPNHPEKDLWSHFKSAVANATSITAMSNFKSLFEVFEKVLSS